jgi:hypothetical protein
MIPHRWPPLSLQGGLFGGFSYCTWSDLPYYYYLQALIFASGVYA